MDEIEEFKIQLNHRRGTFFQIKQNGTTLYLGRVDEYVLVANISRHNDHCNLNTDGVHQKFTIVYVNQITYTEGTIGFDSTIVTLDGEPNCFLVIVLESRINLAQFDDLYVNDINSKYIDQIVKHEINHARTLHIINRYDGELNWFLSEILADSLLILENNNNIDLLRIKKRDIENLLLNDNIPQYYRCSLSVVNDIINTGYPYHSAQIVLEYLNNGFIQGNTIEAITTELNHCIVNG